VYLKKMHLWSADARARSPALQRALTTGQMSVDETLDQSVADIVTSCVSCPFSGREMPYKTWNRIGAALGPRSR
jgi:hypothetical protein